MTAETTLVVGGVVGTICKVLVNGGLTGRMASVAAFFVSAIVIGIFVYSAGDFARATTWGYFAGWASVLATAAGIFHGIENGPSATDVKKFMGTGDGK